MITLNTLKELAERVDKKEIFLDFESVEEETNLQSEVNGQLQNGAVTYGAFQSTSPSGDKYLSIGIYGKIFHIKKYNPTHHELIWGEVVSRKILLLEEKIKAINGKCTAIYTSEGINFDFSDNDYETEQKCRSIFKEIMLTASADV